MTKNICLDSLNSRLDPKVSTSGKSYKVINNNEETLIMYRMQDDIINSYKDDLLFYCYLTRSFDGYERHLAIKKVLKYYSNFEEVIPYIALAIDDYVIENIQAVNTFLTIEMIARLKIFYLENLTIFEYLNQRMTSYWNCYYRYIPKENYIGFVLIKKLAPNI